MAVIFPRWTNWIRVIALVVILGGGAFSVFGVWYWFSPKFTDVGYAPKQPVPFSHKLHAGSLGLDCRYCHYTAEKSAFSAIPPTEVCMGCHRTVKPNSPKLKLVRESFKTGKPIEWVRVHLLPDYSFFNHSVHLAAGVGCSTCHGRVDKMEVVYQTQPLSMSWCLQCHRNPLPHLRPQSKITAMDWEGSEEQKKFTAELRKCVAEPKSCTSPEIKAFLERRKDIQQRRKDIVAGKTVRAHSFLGSVRPIDDPKQLVVYPPEHCSGCHR